MHDFLNDADELNYLSDKIQSHSKTEHECPAEMGLVLCCFHEILARVGLDDGSIILQDHWALLHEVEGRTKQAIEHREREIERIEHLFSIGGPVGPINQQFLIQTLHTLHQNYVRVGDFEKADAILRRIESLREL
jgi:hypothetical protein